MHAFPGRALHLAGPSRSSHSLAATEERNREVWGGEKAEPQLPPFQPGPDSQPGFRGWSGRKRQQVPWADSTRARQLGEHPPLPPLFPGPASRPGALRLARSGWGRSQEGRYGTDLLKRAQGIAERTGVLASAQPSGQRQAGSWEFWFALAHLLLPTPGSYMPLCPPLPLHVPMLLRQQQRCPAVMLL
ncbi:hypothetical protein TREES_T100001079 [Tupaia chinensis]|uniref:Uncharacterized protein n=1 Tax=Tupaia chinensis TaxID=246437 RepID=L9JC97_TUPCH|nr:hypothetical protein TREES_T100001079 [Tupaia chinensis]